MSITALPDPPLRRDGPANFADKGDTFMAALPQFVTEANTLIDETNGIKDTASARADAALASEQAALASQQATAALANAAQAWRDAPLWNAATAYSVGQAAYSPINQRVYRRLIAGTTATDPSADATNWTVIDGGLIVVLVTGTTKAAAQGNHYVLTNVAATTVTLPAVVSEGDTVWVTVANGLDTNVIARNGQTIMGLTEDMTVDRADITTRIRYTNNDWKLV